jgi:dTMP kinase
MEPNIFLVLEGGEGVGKTTQVKMLENVLAKNGYSYISTREPGGTINAEKIRELVLHNNFDSMTNLLMFMGARHENIINFILPNKKKYNFIICDRFVLSTFVYQGLIGGIPLDVISYLHEKINFDIYPDLTLVLDADLDKSYDRLNKRIEINNLDKNPKDWHRKIREGFLTSASFYKGYLEIINSSLDVSDVHEQIINTINLKFNLNLKI